MVNLKKPSRRYADKFLEAVRKSQSLHRGFVSPPADYAAYEQYVKSERRVNRMGFLVVTEETSDLVGVVNVSEIVRGPFQSAYLGYYAFVPFNGRGLMSQGVRQVITHCFVELKLHRLEANIQPENARSIALVEALGFRKEGFSPRYLKVCGQWRDHERWAILSEEWRRAA